MKKATETRQNAADGFLQSKLSFRHLRVLLALSETGTLVAAAARLGVSQPAVSKALAELETGLGVTLHARRGRNNEVPVVAGRLLQLAQRLDSELLRAADELRSQGPDALGELRVGATNAALAELLPAAVAALKSELPLLSVAVHADGRAPMLAALRRGQLDLVVSQLPEQGRPADLKAHALGATCHAVVMSAGHPLARTRHPSWDLLAQQAWIWPLPHTDARAQQDRLWQVAGHALPDHRIETGDLGVIFALLQRMPLMAQVPEDSARAAARAGQALIVTMTVPAARRDLVAWQRLDDTNPSLARLVHHLACEARSQA